MLVLKKNVEFNCVISMSSMAKFILYTGVPISLPNMRRLAMACATLEGDTLSPLRTGDRLFCLAYCVPYNKNNNIWRFHLHKDNKMTICCMHM